MNLTSENEYLRFEKDQLENYELQQKQEFVESSKEINELTKALEKERETMQDRIAAER